MNDVIYLSEDLKKVRKFFGVKATELSLSSHLNEGYITYLETGKTQYPRLDALVRIAFSLNWYRRSAGCSFEDLRKELGENQMLDFMEMCQMKDDRLKG